MLLYVVDNQVGWFDGMVIPTSCEQCATSPQTTFKTNASGDMAPGTLLWQSVQAGRLPSEFDIAIDVDGDGYFDAGSDFVDSNPRGGFTVPLPEPSRWLLLAAGLGCLAALYRARAVRHH